MTDPTDSAPSAEDARTAAALTERLRELMSAGAGMVKGAKIAFDDHLGFMAVTFHAKQLSHAEAMITLGDHADAALITRSMLEGLCLLKWAGQAEERALRWRKFATILDVRLLAERDRKGIPVDRSDRELVRKGLAELDETFWSQKALKAKQEGSEPPADPWVTRWYQPQLRQIFQAVQAEALYDGPYYAMSEWHHWSPGGLARGMWNEGESLGFSGRLVSFQAGWLASAFQALAETSLFTGAHLRLPTSAIEQVVERYVADGALHVSALSDAP